jgi:hypothetical protein
MPVKKGGVGKRRQAIGYKFAVVVLGFDALFPIFMCVVNGIGMRGKAVQQLFLGSPKKQQYRQTQDG